MKEPQTAPNRILANIERREFTCAQLRHNMAADIPYLEVTGKKIIMFKMKDFQF